MGRKEAKYSQYRGRKFKVGEEIVMPRNFLTDIGIFPLDLKGRVLSQNQYGVKMEWAIPAHHLRRYAVVKSGQARTRHRRGQGPCTYKFVEPYLPPHEIPLMVTVISVHDADVLEQMGSSRPPPERIRRMSNPSSRRRAGDGRLLARLSPVST